MITIIVTEGNANNDDNDIADDTYSISIMNSIHCHLCRKLMNDNNAPSADA